MALETDLHLKRAIDVFGAALGLALFTPVLLISGLLIRLSMGRPVLYVGERPGLRGRIFRLYKFRTMTGERGRDGRLLSDANRLTPLGRFLRRLSLDELPQLWNVLKGDMSLVGPRPLSVEYLDRYTPTQARRHEIRPGITGWAQVNGRNALTWEEKFDLDVWYVDHRSCWLDVKILCKTIGLVLRREGIWRQGEMNEPFMGTLPGATRKQSEQVDKLLRRDNSGLSGLRAGEQTCRSY
jgi:sugar transferase EpsL